MSDEAGAPAKRRSWLAGRSSRKEYWISVVVLFAASWIVGSIPRLQAGSTGLSGVLIVVQVRRLHDFGRTGWWALPATVAPLAALVPMVVTTFEVALLVALAAELAVIAWIGAIAGDPQENRFGPAPGAKPLKDVFS